MLLLGAVLEVREYEVVVSLPNNMRGGVSLTNVSDPITRLVELEAHGEAEDDVRTCELASFKTTLLASAILY